MAAMGGHRIALRSIGAAAALAAVFAFGTTAAQAQVELGFAGWGGTSQELISKHLLGQADKLGIKLRIDRHGGWTGIKTHLTSGAPGWDITEVGFKNCEEAAQAKLIQPLDYTVIDKSKVPPDLAHERYIGMFTFNYAITYDKKRHPKAPQNWAEFWDVKTFPGRRAMQDNGLYALESALIADGVAPKDVYAVVKTKAGQDRAFAKLQELKPSVGVWYQSPGQGVQLLRDGEVDYIVNSNGRAAALANDGMDVGYVWNQSFLDTECFMVPNNAAHPKEAMQLINTALDAKGQAEFGATSGFGPVNPKAFELGAIAPKDLAWLPTAPQNISKQIYTDPSWYASPEGVEAYVRFAKFLQ